MPGAAIGALLGLAFSSTAIGVGLAGFLGVSVGTLWLVGASIGSLFDAPSIDLGGSTPNYAFGQLSNTKSQLLPIPIVYGRCRVGGNVFMQTFYDDSLQKMDMFVGVSEGPIQSIKSVYANDLVLIDENGDVVHELAESSINLHLGAPDQAADSREPTGSTYPHTAYIALTLKAQDGLSGNPVISSIVEGRKVWTPLGTVFSRNPAWIVYDFLTNTRYGVGIPTKHIDLDSFTAAAAYCDAPVDGGPRFTLDYIIDTQRPAVDHLQAMLGCFRGYFLARDKIELHVEQAGSVYKELTEDNFVKGTFSWWQKSSDDSPNRIVIEWIDPNNHYEQSSAPFEWTEDIAARGVYEKSISLLGVTRPEQVGRLGNYLLETARRVQNFCAFQVSLQDADIEAGEIISLTYQDFTGWSAKPFRVLAVQDEGQTGNVTITCAEYDAAIYADDALTVDLPVIETPPVTTDDVYSLGLEDVGFLDDGTWIPVVRASWQNPSDYTPTAINVRWRYDGETDWNLSLNSTRLITQARIEGLKSGETVQTWVNCVRPDTGKETTGKIASMVVGKDVTPPGACTGLAATGWFGSILLEWTNPTDKDLNYVELWENAVDDRSGAVKIAEVKGAGFTRYLGSFQGRYYWVRGVDLSGNIGPWNADTGVYGNSDQETHQDFVDLLLKDNPYLQEAIDDLNATIDPIEKDLGIIVDIVQPDSIDTTLPELINVTLPGLTDRLETVEVDLPGAVQRLAERMKEIDADVMDQLRSVSASAVDALLNIAEIGQRITDAGIVVDPDNGEVRIWAVDQLRTEHGVRLSSAEQLISAQEGMISQKVGIADVDARIAQAVFGNVGELLVSGLEAHITSVEQELDAAKGELTQKATVVEVDAIGGRVGTAESKISGLEASVALKATQTEVDELTSRVTTAEFTVDALNGTIGSEIVAIGQEGRDLANLTAEGLVEAILNDSENNEKAKIQLATAKTEIYARVEEGLSAEAGQRTALAAVVNGNHSTYLESTALITDELRAEVTKREQLQSTVDGLDADVISLSGAVAGKSDVIYAASPPEEAKSNDIWCATANSGSYESGSFYRLSGGTWTKITDPFLVKALDENFEGSLAYDLKQLNASVGDLSTTVDEITEVSTTETTASGNFTRNMVAQLGNQVGSGLVEDILNQADTRKNALQQYAMIRQDYDVKIEAGLLSEASAREVLASRIGDAEGAILHESVTRSTQDEALANDITKLQADFGENSVKIKQESEARATETAATGRFSTTLLAQLGNQTGTGLVDAILNGADNRSAAKQQYAYIRQDYNVKIEEGLLSEATARELLATRVGANESAILSEAVSRTTADSAMAKTIDAISAKANKNEADIKTELETRADADEAVAKQVTTLAASTLAGDVTESAAPPGSPTEGQVYYNTTSKKYFWWDGTAWQEVKGVLGKNTAAIQTESIARTTADTSLASQITTLETTTVGGDVPESATAPADDPETGEFYYNTTLKKYFRWNGTEWVEIKGIEGHSRAAIQIVNESVDGIKAKHGVRIDVNGYVTGYELIGDGESGSMVFHVDNFLIGRPGTTSDYPFALGTVDGVTRLSLRNAWIQDAAIKNAKIQNLTIERLKLASGATAGLSWGDSTFASTMVSYTANGVYTPAGASVKIRTESRGRVMVSAYMRAQHWYSTLNMGLYRNGVKILNLGGSGGGSYDPATPVMCFWVDKSPPDSSNTAYSIRVQKISGEAVYVYQRGISVTAIYR